MMVIVFDSKTGNVSRFVKKLGIPAIQVEPGMVMKEHFVLITYTTGFGNIPETTSTFLEVNNKKLVGVASSGNKNWGELFANAGRSISKKYTVPLLHSFEMSGTKKDVKTIQERLEILDEAYRVKQ